MSRLFSWLSGKGKKAAPSGPSLPTMHRVRSKSGWVRAAGYDPDQQALYVQFKDALCRYKVESSYFYGLMHAASAGTYIHTSGLYRTSYEKVA